MYEHKLSNFEKAFLSIIKEHKEDEKEDAILAREIKNILLKGGIREDNLESVTADIMEKVQAHCDKMSDVAREQALDAAYHAQY